MTVRHKGSDLEDAFAQQCEWARLAPPERQYKAITDRRWRWDFAWPDRNLLVEIDGATWTFGRHSRGSGIETDAEKQSTAAAAGFRTMRFTRKMVESGKAVELVEAVLKPPSGPRVVP